MKNRHILFAVAGLLSLAACDKGGFQGPDRSMYDVVETMTLEASARDVVLDAEEVDKVALTFTWTPAREMPDDYLVTYVTFLDVEGNDFSNAVRQVVDDGVFTKEYTTQELQNLLVEKWNKNYSRAVNMQFKVIAKWEGGEKYVMPEVRTIDFSVRPFRPLTFDADRIFLSGDAMTGTTRKPMGKTPESDYIYAEEVYLRAGEMTIPIEYQGMTSYICPADGSVEVPDNDQVDSKPAGTQYNAVVKELKAGATLPAWKIPVEGYWRVIIDIENKTVKFFSPKNRLEPLTVEFAYEGRNPASWILTKTLLAGNYYLNSMTGWDSWRGKAFPFVVSKVDPMILIWSGSSFSVPDKNAGICIKVAQHRADLDSIKQGEGTGGNNPYTDTGVKEEDKDADNISTTFVSKVAAFVPATEPGVAATANMELKMGEWMNTALVFSNVKWKLASTVKISKITIDARNNKIRFD